LKTWKKIGLAVAVLVAAAGGYVVAQIGPRNIVGILLYDKRRDGDWNVGQRAPDVVLAELEGDGEQRLLAKSKGRPLVLIFGSFT